jgi:CTP synthase (UTP-ammonia lyase)
MERQNAFTVSAKETFAKVGSRTPMRRGIYFVTAGQFHPEFLSKPHQPHPLFKGFITAARAHVRQNPL